MRIHVSVQRNHLFGKTNTQKTVAKVKNLRTEGKPSFVYLCTCVLGQRNRSLSLPPWIAFTFELLPKSDDVSLCWFHIPPRVQITFYLHPHPPDHFLCTSPMYRVALAPFHQKRCYWPYLCFYHTSPLVFRTFSLPPSVTETTFTLPQFGQSKLL
jgi:hypothetical protein